MVLSLLCRASQIDKRREELKKKKKEEDSYQ